MGLFSGPSVSRLCAHPGLESGTRNVHPTVFKASTTEVYWFCIRCRGLGYIPTRFDGPLHPEKAQAEPLAEDTRSVVATFGGQEECSCPSSPRSDSTGSGEALGKRRAEISCASKEVLLVPIIDSLVVDSSPCFLLPPCSLPRPLLRAENRCHGRHRDRLQILCTNVTFRLQRLRRFHFMLGRCILIVAFRIIE